MTIAPLVAHIERNGYNFLRRIAFCESLSIVLSHFAGESLLLPVPSGPGLPRVFDAHDSTKVILGGMVTREDALATDTSGSLRLRLRMLGIQYSRIVDGQLEPLSTHSRPVLAVA